VRRAVTLALRALLGLFFRRMEAEGLDRFPASGPAVAVLNHPNGLIDPAVLLALSPRPVSFLAKAPLFRMPVVSFFTRALDSIPVWRPEDGGSSPEKTRETFARAREVLEKGGVIALFPEGTTHDDPSLKPLKSGAARLALGTAARLPPGGSPLSIVPAGLFFPRKTTFRSDALLVFGEPFEVPLVGETDAGPDPRAVRDLTGRIGEALARVTVQADAHEALQLAAAAEAIVTESGGSDLPESFAVRRLLLRGYSRLKETRPEEVEEVTTRIRRHRDALAAARLDEASLAPLETSPGSALVSALAALAVGAVALPFALLGVVTHYPVYRLVDLLAARYARDDESVLATGKLLGGILFFPLLWALLALAAFLRAGATAALVAFLLLPACGLLALLLGERFESSLASLRALGILLFRRRAALRLLAERRQIRERLVSLSSEVPPEG